MMVLVLLIQVALLFVHVMVVGQEQTVQVRSSCTGTWSVINEYPSNTESAIIVGQCKSKYFKIVEGVRQGGVCLLYVVFINDF
jgi:hypothetical protein